MQPNYNGYGYNAYPYQQQNSNPYQQQMQRQNQSLFVLVNNDAEAQAYIVYPNQTVYLYNAKDLTLTIKRANAEGRYEPEKYYLTKENPTSTADKSNEEYVNIKHFLKLQSQVNSIADAVLDLKAKIEPLLKVESED